MRKSIITALLLGSSLLGFSQKVTKASLGSFTFSSYPTLPIPLGYKLYALVDESGMPHPSGKTVSNCISLANRTKVRSAESAELVLRITNVRENTSPLIMEPNPVFHVTETPTVRGKQQREIGFDVVIEDTTGIIFQDTYRKMQEAESDWMKDVPHAEKNVKQQLYTFTLTNELRKYNTLINNKLGTQNFASIYLHVYGATNKSKGTYDYDSLNIAAKNYKQAIQIIQTDEFDAERFSKQVEECVAIWERELDNYRIGDERITEEIAAGLHYNLATYFIFIKDYDSALDELELCEKTHKGFSNAKELYPTVRIWRNAKRSYDKMMEGQSSTSLGK